MVFTSVIASVQNKHCWIAVASMVAGVKTWKNFGKEFASERVEAAYIARTIFVIYSYLKSCVWLLLVTVTLPVTSGSCKTNFSKMKLLKTFPRNSITSKNWVTLIYCDLKGTSWKIDLDDFVDAFDSWHDKRRIKLRWSDDNIKFERSLCKDLCENYIAHCLFVWIFFGLEVVRISRMTRQS